MADADRARDTNAAANPLFLRDDELFAGLDLLNRAYRDFSRHSEDGALKAGLGRAHLRVLQVLARTPPPTVAQLLARLRVTKQSLNPVLKKVIAEGFVEQATDREDRRRRRLALTEKGAALERRLTELQRKRLADAYRKAGAEAVAGFRRVLRDLIDGDPD